jgi:hypothetical protein
MEEVMAFQTALRVSMGGGMHDKASLEQFQYREDARSADGSGEGGCNLGLFH